MVRWWLVLMLGWLASSANAADPQQRSPRKPDASHLATAAETDRPELPARLVKTIRDLSLAALPAAPNHSANPVADQSAAVQLGARLFSDRALSLDGRVSCADCHQPARFFTDGLKRGHAPVRTNPVARNTPTLVGSAWFRWQMWDGRIDSVAAQAAGPLQHADEHGLSLAGLSQVIRSRYAKDYQRVFAQVPDKRDSDLTVLRNTGWALEAYIRTLRPAMNALDAFIEAGLPSSGPVALDASAMRGLVLFTGKAQCIRCHSGPLYSTGGFSNTGVASRIDGKPDEGRAEGLKLLRVSSLKCGGGVFGSAGPDNCRHLVYLRPPSVEDLGAFRIPTLRSIAQTGPYMHDGRYASLEDVLAHYERADNPDGFFGHSEIRPLVLTPQERKDLLVFLRLL